MAELILCELGEQGVLILLTHGQAGAVQHLEAVTVCLLYTSCPEVNVAMEKTNPNASPAIFFDNFDNPVSPFLGGLAWGGGCSPSLSKELVFFTDNLETVSLMAVSYTHLDVYKRQHPHG